MNETCTISKRLTEVWEWKDAIYKEVAHLSTDQALSAILEKARLAAEKYGIVSQPALSALDLKKNDENIKNLNQY